MSERASKTETIADVSLAPLSIHPDPTYYVQSPTSPYRRVCRVIDVSDGGVLGVTGERGAGKSVLLNKLIHDYSGQFLTVNLAAPISTSREMEFFVMLFRHLTQRVISELKSRAKRNSDDIDALGRTAIQRDRSRSTIMAATVMMVLAIGTLIFYQWSQLQQRISSVKTSLSKIEEGYDERVRQRIERDQSELEHLMYSHTKVTEKGPSGQTKKELQDDITALTNETSSLKKRFDDEMKRGQAVLTEVQNVKFPWVSGPQSLLLVIVCLTFSTILGAAIIMPVFPNIFAMRLNPTERGLLIYSERLALKLDYELTRSSERGFELSPTRWLKGSSKLSSEERSRGLSLPELTASYIEFISNVLRVFPGKLLICIDELDKVTDIEHVRFILREIKGALYVKGTFYVVSISNDALRSFEGRMGDQRDIFESTFDDVFAVRPLDLETCLEILTNRIEHGKSSDAMTTTKLDTLATISVFSAGNARDLVRGFRECALSNDKAALPEAGEAWKILFARRFEAISDRARAAAGSAEVRKCFIPLLDSKTLSSDTESQLYRLQTCRTKLNQYIDLTTSDLRTGDDTSVAKRFLRYAVELEILLWARERVSLIPYGEDVRNDAALIISAYQILPFSTADAESILSNLRPHGRRRESVAPIIAPPVRSLDRPLADRENIS